MMQCPYKLVIYIVLCSLSFIQMIVYSWFKVRGKGKAYTISKCAGSLIFVLTAVEALAVGLADRSSGITVDSYTAIITFALLLSACGDFFLAQKGHHRLYLGAGSFALSHVCFVIGYIILAGFRWQALVATVVLFGVEVLSAKLLKLNFHGAARPIAIYIFTITAMACFAVSLLLGDVPRTAAVMTAIGGVLFLISDQVWVNYGLDHSAPKKVLKVINIWTYFPAQMLIAGALLFR